MAETVSKMEGIRRLLAENPELTAADGVKLLKAQFKLDTTPNAFNNAKSVIKKRAAGGGADGQGTKLSESGRAPRQAAKKSVPAEKQAKPAAKAPGAAVTSDLMELQRICNAYGADEVQLIISSFMKR